MEDGDLKHRAMNNDDFEKRLERQALRKIPPEWRADILAATREAAAPQLAACSTRQASRFTFHVSRVTHLLSTIFWPSPRAWAGLAAVWGVILVVNYSVTGSSQVIAKNLTPPSENLMLALQDSDRVATPPAPRAPVEPPNPVLPRPRTQRRNESHIG